MAIKRTSISFPEKLYDKLYKLASDERRSMSSYIQIVMEDFLERTEGVLPYKGTTSKVENVPKPRRKRKILRKKK